MQKNVIEYLLRTAETYPQKIAVQDSVKEITFAQLLERATLLRIIFTIVFALVYALLFEPLGFLISTILFLGAVLFLINGFKHWFQNILVTIIFSAIAWYTFSQLLDVSLP